MNNRDDSKIHSQSGCKARARDETVSGNSIVYVLNPDRHHDGYTGERCGRLLPEGDRPYCDSEPLHIVVWGIGPITRRWKENPIQHLGLWVMVGRSRNFPD